MSAQPSLPPSSPSSDSTVSDVELDTFFTHGLLLPYRFWLALKRDSNTTTSFRIILPSPFVLSIDYPDIDLDEYLNSSPPILGSMMGMFKNAGLRVRLPGKIISVSQNLSPQCKQLKLIGIGFFRYEECRDRNRGWL
jgi:hypothetical protein